MASKEGTPSQSNKRRRSNARRAAAADVSSGAPPAPEPVSTSPNDNAQPKKAAGTESLSVLVCDRTPLSVGVMQAWASQVCKGGAGQFVAVCMSTEEKQGVDFSGGGITRDQLLVQYAGPDYIKMLRSVCMKWNKANLHVFVAPALSCQVMEDWKGNPPDSTARLYLLGRQWEDLSCTEDTSRWTVVPSPTCLLGNNNQPPSLKLTSSMKGTADLTPLLFKAPWFQQFHKEQFQNQFSNASIRGALEELERFVLDGYSRSETQYSAQLPQAIQQIFQRQLSAIANLPERNYIHRQNKSPTWTKFANAYRSIFVTLYHQMVTFDGDDSILPLLWQKMTNEYLCFLDHGFWAIPARDLEYSLAFQPYGKKYFLQCRDYDQSRQGRVLYFRALVQNHGNAKTYSKHLLHHLRCIVKCLE